MTPASTAPAGTSPPSTAAGAARSSATRRWRSSRARRRRSRSSRRSNRKTVTQPTPGTTIYDLGQNFAGWARITAHGAAGTKVRLRFGELLNSDGTLYTANLRSAQQTDTYTLKGTGSETYEPRFTYHGFRYVEVTGAHARRARGPRGHVRSPGLRQLHQLQHPS